MIKFIILSDIIKLIIDHIIFLSLAHLIPPSKTCGCLNPKCLFRLYILWGFIKYNRLLSYCQEALHNSHTAFYDFQGFMDLDISWLFQELHCLFTIQGSSTSGLNFLGYQLLGSPLLMWIWRFPALDLTVFNILSPNKYILVLICSCCCTRHYLLSSHHRTAHFLVGVNYHSQMFWEHKLLFLGLDHLYSCWYCFWSYIGLQWPKEYNLNHIMNMYSSSSTSGSLMYIVYKSILCLYLCPSIRVGIFNIYNLNISNQAHTHNHSRLPRVLHCFISCNYYHHLLTKFHASHFYQYLAADYHCC